MVSHGDEIRSSFTNANDSLKRWRLWFFSVGVLSSTNRSSIEDHQRYYSPSIHVILCNADARVSICTLGIFNLKVILFSVGILLQGVPPCMGSLTFTGGRTPTWHPSSPQASKIFELRCSRNDATTVQPPNRQRVSPTLAPWDAKNMSPLSSNTRMQ